MEEFVFYFVKKFSLIFKFHSCRKKRKKKRKSNLYPIENARFFFHTFQIQFSTILFFLYFP